MTIQLETMKDAFIMENKQIGELAREFELPDDLIDVIVDNAPKLDTMGEMIMYFVDESFRRGPIMGLYLFNESLKESFDQIEKDSDK